MPYRRAGKGASESPAGKPRARRRVLPSEAPCPAIRRCRLLLPSGPAFSVRHTCRGLPACPAPPEKNGPSGMAGSSSCGLHSPPFPPSRLLAARHLHGVATARNRASLLRKTLLLSEFIPGLLLPDIRLFSPYPPCLPYRHSALGAGLTPEQGNFRSPDGSSIIRLFSPFHARRNRHAPFRRPRKQ